MYHVATVRFVMTASACLMRAALAPLAKIVNIVTMGVAERTGHAHAGLAMTARFVMMENAWTMRVALAHHAATAKSAMMENV